MPGVKGIFAAIYDDVRVPGLSPKANVPSVHIVVPFDAHRTNGNRYVKWYDPDSMVGGIKDKAWRYFYKRWHEGTYFGLGKQRTLDLRKRGFRWVVILGVNGEEVVDALAENPYGAWKNLEDHFRGRLRKQNSGGAGRS